VNRICANGEFTANLAAAKSMEISSSPVTYWPWGINFKLFGFGVPAVATNKKRSGLANMVL